MSTTNDIVEVEQTKADECNKRLRQGWKLLGVFQRWHDGEQWAYPLYVVGRPQQKETKNDTEH